MWPRVRGNHARAATAAGTDQAPSEPRQPRPDASASGTATPAATAAAPLTAIV